MKREIQNMKQVKFVAVLTTKDLRKVLECFQGNETCVLKTNEGFIVGINTKDTYARMSDRDVKSILSQGITCFGWMDRDDAIYFTGGAASLLKELGFRNSKEEPVFAYKEGNSLVVENMSEIYIGYYKFFKSDLPCKSYPINKLTDIKWANFCKEFKI